MVRARDVTAFSPEAMRQPSARWHTIWCADIRPHRAGVSGLIVLNRRRISALHSSRAKVFIEPAHEPISRSPPAARKASRARARPPSACSRICRNSGSFRSESNCGHAASVGLTKYPLSTARRRYPDRLRIRRHRRAAIPAGRSPLDRRGSSTPPNADRLTSMSRPAPIEPGQQVLDPRSKIGMREAWRISMSRCRASSRRPASPSPMTRMPSSAPASRGGGAMDIRRSMSPAISRVWSRLVGDVGIEPPCFHVRSDGLLVQAAVAARMYESGEEFGIVAVALGFAEQAHQCARRLADVGFEVGVELVRDREPRAQRERATKRFLGSCLAVGRRLDVLANQAMAPAKVGPCRRETGIQFDARAIQIASAGAIRRRFAPARWRADRVRRRARREGNPASAPRCRQ